MGTSVRKRGLATFLPGRLWLEKGQASDYAELERFHYLPKRPATWAGVWTVRYRESEERGSGSLSPTLPGRPAAQDRVVAVGVLSYPVPCRRARERYFNLTGQSFAQKLAFANANLRTISRVIVHPQFRGIGLASALVRHMCHHCPTPYIEASAAMGRAHPFFEKAGMHRIDPLTDEPVYYVMSHPPS